jgi:hypothetical protein
MPLVAWQQSNLFVWMSVLEPEKRESIPMSLDQFQDSSSVGVHPVAVILAGLR